MKRESWGSRLGFILAVSGSAVGLANILRFPHLVGEYGGAAFVFVYVFFLILLGFPLLLGEISVGRATGKSPAKAFRMLGGKGWGAVGGMTIITGFIVSGFYSAMAGWIVGYLIEALKGNLTNFATVGHSKEYFEAWMQSPFLTLSSLILFLGMSIAVLYLGVRKGIERANKILMPLLVFLLLVLLCWGLSLPRSFEAVKFLWMPDLKALTAYGILAALGQAFFTLSLGQGTMVTYGSYTSKSENLIYSCFPIVLMDTFISFVAAGVVFTILYSVGAEGAGGSALLFHTLPVVFSKIPFGYILAPLFFLLVMLAALTSEISAMEPSVAYLMDKFGWSRKKCVTLVGAGAFLIGIPCALSNNLLADVRFFGHSVMDGLVYLGSDILIPIGGLAAALLIGWRWKGKQWMEEVSQGASAFMKANDWLKPYLTFCVKYVAPLLIGIVLFQTLAT